MEKSQALVDEAGIMPFLKLFVEVEGKKGGPGGTKPTGPHEVKVLRDRVISAKDYQTGDEIPVVEYLLEEDGKEVRYQVTVKDKKGELHYLIQRLAEVEKDEVIVLEGKKGKNSSYVEVRRDTESGGEELPTVDVDEDLVEDEK